VYNSISFSIPCTHTAWLQEARAAAVAAAAAQRSLAAQLAGAQAQAEELAGRWRVSDLALNNEVGGGRAGVMMGEGGWFWTWGVFRGRWDLLATTLMLLIYRGHTHAADAR
jgi:hypothetical protein